MKMAWRRYRNVKKPHLAPQRSADPLAPHESETEKRKDGGGAPVLEGRVGTVSYTHLTLPTKRIV